MMKCCDRAGLRGTRWRAGWLWLGCLGQVGWVLCGATHTVELLASNRFVPATLTIQAGDTVNWINRGGIHDVVHRATPPLFRSNLFGPGQSFSFTFAQAGTYPYFCSPHDNLGMRGTITVLAPVPPEISHPRRLPGGGFEFLVRGSAEKTYRVEASSNLDEWTEVQTVTADSEEFTVTIPPPDAGARFFRVVEL